MAPIIIGAGPAGTAALQRRAGPKAALLDEQPRPGGQIYRNVTQVAPDVAKILGPDYLHGRTLATPLVDVGVDLHFATMVWDIAPNLTVSALSAGRSFQLHAPQLIAATGAM
jgi:thioredoxin reductase